MLVSHDMHLLSLVAERLWLVDQGGVAPWQGDLDDYRAMLLSSSDDKPMRAPAKPAPKRASRDEILELRAEARRAEDRITKLTEMLDKLGVKMADPAVYDDPLEVKKWGRKHAEATEAMTRAESLWMKALERLERAERG